jgi:signal transduction histidine kinase
VLLDLVIGAVTFSIIITLLATGVGLLVTLLLAVPVIWLLFVGAAGLGRLERSRFAALLDHEIAPPHPPLPDESWLRRLWARVKTPSRWREIGYHLALLPIGVVTFTAAVVVWCGSATLAALPLYVSALPGGTAEFGIFDVGQGLGALALAAVGVAGLVLVAPWATLGLAAMDTAIADRLLGPTAAQASAAELARVRASRTAAVDSAEAERRRIERDLHDGAQARLVNLAMELGRAEASFETDPDHARQLVAGAHVEAKAALAELRDLVRGIHPAILDDRGLDAALSSVVARVPIPVDLDIDLPERPPAAVESAAYFIVTEALTNATLHSGAGRVRVAIARRGDRLAIDVTDDGAGGADPAAGSGLRGLEERVRALDGWMNVISPPGGPTSVLVELSCAS